MIKKAIQLTSAKNKATITIDRDDIKAVQDVSSGDLAGNAKVLTRSIGNFYVNETEEAINKVAFSEVLVVK